MQCVEVKAGYFSPVVGWLEIKADDGGATNISFVEHAEDSRRPTSHPILETFLTELDDYFSLKSGAFSTPAHFTSGTPFQIKVCPSDSPFSNSNESARRITGKIKRRSY